MKKSGIKEKRNKRNGKYYKKKGEEKQEKHINKKKQ